MSSIALRVLAVIALLGAIATAVVVLDNRSAVGVPSPELFERHPGLEDLRRRIAADSQGGVRKATVQAAPIAATLGSGSAEPFTAPAPAAPNGYSFTSAPTPLAVAPYRPPSKRNAGVESTQDNTLGWLFADAGDAPLAAIADLAQRMERDWVFGWLRLADGATVQDVRNAVAPLGIDILAATGPLLRSRLPADPASLAAATELPSVSGLGVVPPERKAHEAFAAELHAAPLGQLPVLITLMAHDPDGRWRRALQARGVEVGRFDADIRAYAANVDAAAFDAALQADFVLAIEPMGMYQATHDTAVPAMGADAVRFHTDAPGIFRGTGGGGVPIGVMDTGLNINHLDIASHRSSICGANFIYNDHRTEDADLWIDQNGHGTHVTGTIAGNGSAKQRYAGMAPAVAHIRFAKVLSLHGIGPFDSVSRGMDFLTRASACDNDSLAAKPLVVNMSLAANSRQWEGRTYGERKLDAVVWAHRQLYVVANANADISGFSNYGAAKNSLSVGAVYDNGELARFSSWGPTFDGRLAPQLVATGVDVYSARGQGSRGGYVSNSGTSMASPSVAGVAALLLDAVADYREQPALTRARLMASALKPDAWLDAGGAFPADNSGGPGVLQAQYGLGKASARTSVLQRKRADGWENGAATSTLTADSYGHQDIVVPEGASRLDLVLAWDEPPADTIGSTVLNDLDLWLDKDADCTAAACGEHASTSRRDNVEWIIVKNPAAGTYRARVVPQRVYTAAPRAGLAWTIIRDASTPSLRLAVEESRPIAELKYRVVLSVSVDAYVAAGVQVALSGCRAADGMCSPRVQILPVNGEDDGVEHSPLPNRPYTLLGEVGVGERQRVEFDVELDAEDAVRLYFTASAWNADPAVVSVGLDADDDPEAQPPAEVSPPANDHFADAATLDGASGHVDADALTATIEQGEPAALRLGASFVGSIWYRWTAPTRGATRFSTSVGAHVAVFQGDRIAALTPIGANPWNVSFFAEEGQTYRVRVSCLVDTVNLCRPAQMRWSQGPRPVNDDFAAAVELPDAEGETAGDNRGATLEPGERFGDLAATVWYRWTAHEDGGWRFRADQGASFVFVFTGDHVAALRLVSGHYDYAPLRVQAGAEYRIAVAARDAFQAGRAFTLTWEKHEQDAGADDFANAAGLEGATGSEGITVRADHSVEPGEPAQTGVRTRWWGWTAPSNGRFAWHLSDASHTEIKLAVFAPVEAADAEGTPSLATLELLASTGPGVTGTELAFDAAGGQRYWISAGLHSGDSTAFLPRNRSATLRWGETPANDSLAQAIALDGSSGTTTFAGLFATLDPGERDGILGASSLWWSFTPPKAGWYRFWLDETTSATLAVYRVRGAGFDGLQLVARSHGDWQAPDADDATAVLFDAVAEQRYLIRVGQRGERDDSETTLNWDETNAPTWLRYAGRLRASALGLDAPETSATPALAFEDRGAVLYLATSQGVHILARDAASGTLGQARVANMEEQPNGLLWDRGRGKLYMHVGCRGWRQLAPADDSRLALVDEGALEIVTHGDVRPCGVRHGAFLDSTGAFLYHGHPSGVEVYSLGETGLTSVQSVAIEGLMHAVSNHAGTRVYATDGDSLQAFTRDENTGELTAAGEVELTVRAVAIAISDDDAYLVALARDGGTETYDLAVEGAVPRRLNNLNAFGNASWRDPGGHCGFIAARRGAAAIDAFCWNSAFSAAIRVADESAKLAATDYVANWQADRFNNYIPEFKSQALATSPDGQHAYVYSEGDILIFERVGNQPPAQSEDATNASADRPWHGVPATVLLSR